MTPARRNPKALRVPTNKNYSVAMEPKHFNKWKKGLNV